MAAWMEMVALFEKGGLVMPLLLAGSVLAVAVAVERFRVFGRATAGMEFFRAQLSEKLTAGDLAAALELSCQYQNLSAVVAAAGLSRRERGSRAMELVMEETANRGAARLRQRLDLLSLMVTMAPLLGLLGTVVGMIRAFNVLNVSSGQPFAITGGVGEALVATAAGLCVAILALSLLSYFRMRLDAVLGDLEETAAMVLEATLEQES